MAIKIEDFITELKEMKVADLNQLVKAIEEEFGVTAAAPMAAAATTETATEEVSVKLIGPGSNKIAVIKLVRDVMGLALMEAKKFADNGGVIKEGVSPEEAETIMAPFKEAGADIVAE